MSEPFYLLANQHNALLARGGDWLGTRQEKLLYRTQHKDEIVNLKVDHAVKSPDLRMRVIEASILEGKLIFDDDKLIEFVKPIDDSQQESLLAEASAGETKLSLIETDPMPDESHDSPSNTGDARSDVLTTPENTDDLGNSRQGLSSAG